MPKLGTRVAHLPNGKAVDCVLYYLPAPSTFDEPYFAITAVKSEFIIADHQMLKRVYIKGSSFLGCTGKTEQEAMADFKLYLADYETNALTKVPVIFIKIDDAQHEGFSYGADDECKARINFKYVVGYYVDINGERNYYSDKVYHKLRSDQKLYRPETEYTMVPFTEQALRRCEEIITQFVSINDKLKMFFESPDVAMKTLSSATNLLTKGGEG